MSASGGALARNYAEALLELAEQSGELESFGQFIEVTARAVEGSPQVTAALMSPKVPKAAKSEILGNALTQVGAPRSFVLFLQAVIRRGRQGMFGPIATAYRELLDEKQNRVRAVVTVARVPDGALERAIESALVRLLDKEVVASFSVDPSILGGAIVRVGDRVYDGSVRRSLVRLRRQLLSK